MKELSPLKTYFILGAENSDSYVIGYLVKNIDYLVIYGDGRSIVELNKLNLSAADNIIIFSHGIVYSNNKHGLLLNNFDNDFDYYTKTHFQRIKNSIYNNPINIELLSCYSGMATEDVSSLPSDSTLITTAKENMLLDYVVKLLLESSEKFIAYRNPFIKFILYIYTYPDESTFTINLLNSPITFKVLISSIEDYSAEGIKEWQIKQIYNYRIFLERLKNNTNLKNQVKIENAIEFLTNNLDQTIKESSIYKYRELMLLSAVYNGNLDITKHLIEQGTNVNSSDNQQMTALHLSSQLGHLTLSKYLLNAGANKEAENEGGETPLFTAIRAEEVEIIQLLIQNKVNIERINSIGASPLLISITFGNVPIAKELIKGGALVNQVNEKTNMFPMDFVISKNDIVMAKLLLASGATSLHFHKPKMMVGAPFIAKEYDFFIQDPIKYILEHNEDAKLALNALVELETHTQAHVMHLFPKIEQTKDCLTKQMVGIIEDLNAICGENGSYYSDPEL